MPIRTHCRLSMCKTDDSLCSSTVQPIWSAQRSGSAAGRAADRPLQPVVRRHSQAPLFLSSQTFGSQSSTLFSSHDPRKLAVLVRFGSLDDFHTPRTQLLQQLAGVIDPVVDHEGGFAWAEPLAVFLREMPHSKASILGLVVRPFEDSAAKVFQRHAQVLLIPRCQCTAVAFALEEDAAGSGNLRHRCPPAI